MVSLFNALNISTNALTVNESAISVVSHNVANMNTEGYSKQKVNLATRNIAGAIGDSVQAQIRANGGVKIANVMRYNDSYLNNYYRDQLSILKGYEAQLGNLGDLADVFNDLEGEGISAALDDFYKAVNNLNEYPASSTARVNFIESAKTLTNTLNAKDLQLSQLTSQALGDGDSVEALRASQIYDEFEVFNNLLDELAGINKALQVTQTGTLEANNLLDKRDMLLNDIAKFVDIDVEENPFNGSVTLYVGGEALVKGAKVTGELGIMTAREFVEANPEKYPNGYPADWIVRDEAGEPVLDVNGNLIAREKVVISIISPDGDVINENANSVLTTGSLGGLLHSADVEADGMNVGVAQETLNNIAQAVANLFNVLNTRDGAYSINPNDTGKLLKVDDNNKTLIFVGSDGTGDKITAGNIQINSELLSDTGCWKIACAYFANPDGLDVPPTFDENAIGNAQNAVAMLETRTAKQPQFGNMTVEDYYTNLLGKIAATGSSAQALVDTQADVVESINSQILSNNSVDINEELVDLVKYQTAYSAAAQVFNTCNTCLDTLMALGG